MPVMTQTNMLRPARETLPTMYDLPSEEIGDAGMPDEYHVHQSVLLDQTFQPSTVPPDEVFSAVDMNLYFDVRHPLWYKRPDWFGVVGVSRWYEGRDPRLSYVTWQEDSAPLIVVELLSPGTEKDDLGQRLRDANDPPTKWEVYERLLRVPYYAVYGREANELRFFQLNGTRYQEVTEHDGRFWIPEAGLSLGLWQGSYRWWSQRLWLRWFDAQGNLIPVADELVLQERVRAEQERALTEQERMRAEQERQLKEAALRRETQLQHRAEQAEQSAEQERQRAERLAELLRQLGQDPE